MDSRSLDFDVIFPDEREKGDTTLRQCQLVMLRLLKIFDYLCKKHDINYFLTGGSLLGAVRHQGFIPWDDDIDVGMTRSEYKKFLKYAVPELPNDIFFQTAQTDMFYPKASQVDARLRDKYSSFNPTDKIKRDHQGLMLDIFVYDKAFLPHNVFIVTFNKFLRKFLKTSVRRARLLEWVSRWTPLPLVYSSNFLLNYGEIGTYVKPKELHTLVRQKFEDTEVLIPDLYDSYLKRQFGDYMQLPPVEKRFSHHKVLPDPFTPCDHPQILFWKDRKKEKAEAEV